MRKAEETVARRMLEKLAPPVKALTVAINERLTPELRKNMPEYQVLDAEQWLKKVSKMDASWTMVLKGQVMAKDIPITQEETTRAVSGAKACQQLLESSLSIAAAAVAPSQPLEKRRIPSKRRVKDDDEKKNRKKSKKARQPDSDASP